MRSIEKVRSLLDAIDASPDCNVGITPDDRSLIVIRWIHGTQDGALYAQVLRWAGLDVARKASPGIWAVDLAALRAEVAEADRLASLPSGVDAMLGPIPPDAE